MFPILKDDFTITETYSPASSSPIPCPIVVYGGADDVRYDLNMLEAWAECSCPGACTVRLFPGGHNYLFRDIESKSVFLDTLRLDLKTVCEVDGVAEAPGGVPLLRAGSMSSAHSTTSDAAATVGSSTSYITSSKMTPPSMTSFDATHMMDTERSSAKGGPSFSTGKDANAALNKNTAGCLNCLIM